MGQVQAEVITHWNGIDQRGESLRTTRAGLQDPREIVNFILDGNGHLFMPRAVNTLIHTFTGEGSILSLRYVAYPDGLVIQTETKIWYLQRGETTPVLVGTPDDPEWRIWALSGPDVSYVGYAARGTSSGGQTWKLEPDGSGGVTITELTDQPVASFSTFYKGRRFVMDRGREILFSELNQLETFLEDNVFNIAGDDGGNSLMANPGFVKGMVGWEGFLTIFLTGSIWILTGSSIENWQLRQAETTVGNTSEWTLVASEMGVFSYGAGNLKNDNFFMFTGNRAVNISKNITPLVPPWLTGLNDIERVPRPKAANHYDRYIVALGNPNANDIQLLVWDMQTEAWTSFDGFVKSEFEPAALGAFYANGLGLYFAEEAQTIQRASGRSARVVMGWHDEGHTSGLSRILGVKLSGKKSGTGSPTVTISATVPGTGAPVATSSAVALTDDVFDGILLPVNIRGKAAEITLTVTPANDDNTVLIESLQLVTSRKGEKLSRA